MGKQKKTLRIELPGTCKPCQTAQQRDQVERCGFGCAKGGKFLGCFKSPEFFLDQVFYREGDGHVFFLANEETCK